MSGITRITRCTGRSRNSRPARLSGASGILEEQDDLVRFAESRAYMRKGFDVKTLIAGKNGFVLFSWVSTPHHFLL